MYLLNFFVDLLDKRSFSGLVSEPLAVLFFGAALFTVTAGLRFLLSKKDRRAEKLTGEMKEAVAVNNN